jgi:hypothetical protein
MKITTRTHDKYINIEVDIDSAHFDLGFHGTSEAKELLEHLRETVEGLELEIEDIERHALDLLA